MGIAVVTEDTNYLLILEAKGESIEVLGSILLPSVPYFVRAIDLNRDRIEDVVVFARSRFGDRNDLIISYLGNGDGTFQSPQYTETLSGTVSADFGDLNGDGYPDLAVLSGGMKTLQLYDNLYYTLE